MSTENHVNESILNDEIKEWQKKNRIDHMTYLKGMEVLESDVQKQVIDAMNEYDYEKYTAKDVERALAHESRTPEDFAALLSPAALPYLEQMAQAVELLFANASRYSLQRDKSVCISSYFLSRIVCPFVRISIESLGWIPSLSRICLGRTILPRSSMDLIVPPFLGDL